MSVLLAALDTFIVLVTTAWMVMGPVVLWRVRRGRVPAHQGANSDLEPVSILKPVAGIDDSLEENLRTFFAQDYPRYEIVFGVQGEDIRARRSYAVSSAIVPMSMRASSCTTAAAGSTPR